MDSAKRRAVRVNPMCVISACFLLACAAQSHAVNLSANGLGQALIYPYYTTNAGQQTLVSIVNTTSVGKIVKVRFREAYNGRAVLDFNLYLAAEDAWTASVFALADAGLGGDAAGILGYDTSCTDPPPIGSGKLPHGSRYQRFTSERYTGALADTGPSSDSRTREGFVEMILMSDIAPGSALAQLVGHTLGPPLCDTAQLEAAAGAVAPTLDPGTAMPGSHADGGLFGSAAIVDVANGMFFAYSADALDGFSYRSLYTLPGDAQPTLASVNDRDDALHATAHVIVDDAAISATFPGADGVSRAIDAVSAVFAANAVFNEYAIANDGAAATDWVLTFPTKNLYVDTQPGGAIAGSASAFGPFNAPFGVPLAGASCIGGDARVIGTFDREGNAFPYECGFSTCPPIPLLCQQTAVVRFPGGADALHSQLPSFVPLARLADGGWIRWEFPGRQLAPAANGNVFHGVPVTGFAATRYTNAYVPVAGGLAIGNYSGAWRHRATSACTNGSGACK